MTAPDEPSVRITLTQIYDKLVHVESELTGLKSEVSGIPARVGDLESRVGRLEITKAKAIGAIVGASVVSGSAGASLASLLA